MAVANLLIAKNLSPSELKKSSIPDRFSRLFWIGFFYGGEKYRIVLKKEEPQVLLRGFGVSLQDFKKVQDIVSSIHEGMLIGGICKDDSDYLGEIAIKDIPTQKDVVDFYGRYIQYFKDVRIEVAWYEHLPGEIAEKSNLPQKKIKLYFN